MYSSKKIFFHGGAGIVVALLIIAIIVSPLVLPTSQVEAKTGVLIIKLTDAPVPDLVHLNITITEVKVSNNSGTWNKLPISGGSLYFDLLQLQNVTQDLAIGSIPIGNYSKIRLRIASANATFADGRTITLNVPPGHIDLQVHFEIKPGKTTSLIIDIIVDKTKIAERGDPEQPANLNPQFKTIILPPS